MINKETLLQWEARVNALQMRERLLLLVTLIALTFGVFDLLLLSPLQQRLQQTEQSLVEVQSQLAVITQQTREFASDRDPLADRKQQRDALVQTIADYEQQLEQRMGNLLGKDEAPQLLYELLDNQRNLRLVSLTTHNGLFAEQTLGTPMTGGLNRFNLELNLQGSYLDMLDFVQAMEASDWQLFWDKLSLDVVEHPTANINIQLYTLGTGS